MQLWFYKSKHGDWQDTLISWWTKGPHSHVELVFTSPSTKGLGSLCFSSSPRDGGCRMKRIKSSDHWDVIDLSPRILEVAKSYIFRRKLKKDPEELALRLEGGIKTWCSAQNGKKYDWKAVLGWTFYEPRFEDRSKWYCSEVTLYALKKFGVWKGDHRIHPNAMYTEMKKGMYTEMKKGMYTEMKKGMKT